jgi:hypothetical protein
MPEQVDCWEISAFNPLFRSILSLRHNAFEYHRLTFQNRRTLTAEQHGQ